MNRTILVAFVAEFGPLFSFFVAGRITDFFSAVLILMMTTAIAVVASLLYDRRLPWLPIVSAFFVLIGGCITLIYQQPDAVILADTLYYLTISGALLYTLKRNMLILKRMFDTVLALTDEGWRVLTWRWFWFLLLAAVANEIARAVLSPENWIDYRFFKSMVVTGFACYQFTLSAQYRILDQSTRFGLRIHRRE